MKIISPGFSGDTTALKDLPALQAKKARMPVKSVPSLADANSAWRLMFGAARRTSPAEDAFSLHANRPYDYEDDQLEDIWLSNSPRHEPRWRKANKDADRLLRLAYEKGLDPQATAFMVSSSTKLLSVAARGLPNMPHDWIHGMRLYDLAQNEALGLGHIYEMVLNTNPAVAYLVNINTPLATRWVIAHVYGHTDFMKRNRFFKDTRPAEILDIVGRHRTEMKAYVEDLSIPRDPDTKRNPVKEFTDKVHSIEHLIDHDTEDHPLSDFEITEYVPPVHPAVRGKPSQAQTIDLKDRYLYSEQEWERMRVEAQKKTMAVKQKFPTGIDRDLLGFLAKHSPGLASWQRRILQMKREQAYYFLPIKQTQIMNEGWASFWHTKLLIEDPKTTLDQIREFDQLNSGVISGKNNPMNPYFLGFNIWQDLYIKAGLGLPLQKDTPPQYRKQTMLTIGRDPQFNEERALQALREIAGEDRDYTFVEKYLTPSLVEKMQLYKLRVPEGFKLFSNYKEYHAQKEQAYEQVYNAILGRLQYGSRPILEVVDGDFQDNGELLINHSYTTDDLHIEDAKDTLKIIAQIWGRTVHLDTYLRKDKKNPKSALTAIRYTFDPKKPDELKTYLRTDRKTTGEAKIKSDGTIDDGSQNHYYYY